MSVSSAPAGTSSAGLGRVDTPLDEAQASSGPAEQDREREKRKID